MSTRNFQFRRALLPAIMFIAVWLVHFLWLGLFPDEDPAQNRWAEVPAISETTWWERYVDTQSYWLGFSYAACLAFVAIAFRRYRERSCCSARNVAIGGISFGGFLAVAGCFLLGCCGSPMLVVWLNLFGAAFLPMLKPLVAGITVAMILLAWWLMNRRAKSPAACGPPENQGGGCASRDPTRH